MPQLGQSVYCRVSYDREEPVAKKLQDPKRLEPRKTVKECPFETVVYVPHVNSPRTMGLRGDAATATAWPTRLCPSTATARNRPISRKHSNTGTIVSMRLNSHLFRPPLLRLYSPLIGHWWSGIQKASTDQPNCKSNCSRQKGTSHIGPGPRTRHTRTCYKKDDILHFF